MPDGRIKINRAPVLTLWAAVVAERLGFDRATLLTLGQAVAGLSAWAKGVSLGIIEPTPDAVRERSDKLAEGESLRVDMLGWAALCLSRSIIQPEVDLRKVLRAQQLAALA